MAAPFCLKPFLTPAGEYAPFNAARSYPYSYDTFAGASGTNLLSHSMNVGTGWISGVNSYSMPVVNGLNQAYGPPLTPLAVLTNPGLSDGIWTFTTTLNAAVAGEIFSPLMVFRCLDNNDYCYIYYDKPVASQAKFLFYTVQAGIASNDFFVNVTDQSSPLQWKMIIKGSTLWCYINGAFVFRYDGLPRPTATQLGIQFNSVATDAYVSDWKFASLVNGIAG